MQDKRKLNNGLETIAVTSFLSFSYKPIKQEFAYSDYRLPSQFCSKNGKFDTSKKYTQIGGAMKKYITNNDYKSNGEQLKKMHSSRLNKQRPSERNKENRTSHDERKPDEEVLPVFVPPKLKKEFVYKKCRQFAKNLTSLDFRVSKLEALDYESDTSDIEHGFGFYNMAGERDKDVVQGFDVDQKHPKVQKKIERFIRLAEDTPINVEVVPDTIERNERNQLARSLLKDEKDIDETIKKLMKLKINIDVLKENKEINKIQGATYSAACKISDSINNMDIQQTVNKVEDIVDKVHTNIVGDELGDKILTTVKATNRVANVINSVCDTTSEFSSNFLEYIKKIYDTVIQWEEYLMSVFGEYKTFARCIIQAFLINFSVEYLLRNHNDSWDIVLKELLVFIGTSAARIYFNGEHWSEVILTTIRLMIMKIGIRVGIHNAENKVQGRDSIVLPFATCLGMALCATTGKSMTEKLFNSISRFGGIIAFSTKFDILLRSVYNVIPEVIKEFFFNHFPCAYEMIQLSWYDEDFKKDFAEIQGLVKNPDHIFYSSHNTKRFLDLFNGMRDEYLPKYGHFSFFQQSTVMDKLDCVFDEVKRRGLVPGKRHCPFVVWIAGDSGVGKSSLAQYIATQLIDPNVSYEKQVYSWNPALEFQDGYNHQPIVLLNDYMQTTNMGEEQLLISMKDACDWMLNSSSVDDEKLGKKGEMRFTSKMIIITSNITHLYNSTYIRDTGAFNRRRDILIKMSFRDERKFDHLNTNYKWCRFSTQDPIVNIVDQEIKGVKELIDLISQNYEKHIKLSQDRIQKGLRIQSDEFEDTRSEPGILRTILMNRLQEYKERSVDFIKQHYKKILFGTTIFGMSMYYFVKFIYGMNPVLVQAFNSGDQITVSKVHKVVANRLNRKVQGTSLVNSDNVLDKIESNLFRITTCIRVDGQSLVRSVNALYIGDDKILVPKHIFYRGDTKIDTGDLILINKGEILYETTFDSTLLTETTEDYAFYNVRYLMPRYKRIDYLFDDGMVPMDEIINIMILRQAFDATKMDRYLLEARYIKGVVCTDDIGKGRDFVGKHMLKFRSPLAYGDCGTPILAQINGNWKIVGIHVGGCDNHQYAQIVSIPTIHRGDIPNVQGFQEIWDHNHDKGQFILTSKVDSSKFPYANTTTKISKSICFEALQQHTTEPCVLSPRDPRNIDHISPLHEGTLQMGKILNPINKRDYPEILQYLRMNHRSMFAENYDILSLEEAINGIDGLDRLDFQTSPGYPYTIGHIKKMDMFYFDGELWKPTECFMNEYHKFIEKSKEEGMNIIWTNCAKDERRPIEKILKTRIFTVSNILFTVLGRQIFGKYVANYVKNRFQHGGMIGINPYSSEWDQLYNYLAEFANANDGDYSKFDKDLLKEIFEIFSIFVKSLIPNVLLYGKGTHEWIDEFLYNTLFSQILTILDGEKVCVTSLHANPSGWFLTVFFNDFANKVYMYSAWMKLNPHLINRERKYLENVRIVFYGDDNLYTVSDDYKEIYNAAKISDVLKEEYNITYTSGDKGKVVSFNKNLLECTFLKNHFVPKEGRIVAGLEKSVIQEMVSWTKDNDKSLDQILNTALRFSYFWGRDYFDYNYSKLRKYSKNLITYDEIDYEFQSHKGLNFELYSKMENKRYEQLLSQLSTVKSGNKNKIQSINKSEGLRDDNAVRETMRNFGVSMVNQNVVEMVREPVIVPRVEIPEVASTLKKLLARPLLVLNTEISAGTFGFITSLPFPNDWVSASRAMQDLAQAYFLFRGKIKAQITLQSTPYNAGALVAHFSYKNNSSYADNYTDGMLNAWIRPHVELDYSDNGSNKIMDIPWKFKREYCDFEVDPADNIGNLHFHNFISNVYTARLLVYIWVEDAEVVVTRVKRPVVQGLTLFGDNITNVSTQVGNVAGNVCPANITGDKFDTKNSLELSALDQPTIPLESQQVVTNRMGFASNADQIEQKEKLMLHPSEQTMSTFDTFGINEDEMSIDYLKRKWSILELTSRQPQSTRMIYSNSANPYDVLGAVAVGPNGGYSKFANIFPSLTFANNTFLDWISRNHTFWRGCRGEDGSLEYRFKFACNRFQSGRVAIIYNPLSTWGSFWGDPFSISGLTMSQEILGACYVAYFDINGQNNDIIVRLPYVSDTPWKVINNGNPSNSVPHDIVNNQYRNSFCGVLAIVAITPLVSPEGQPSSIEIIPFVRGAPGFQIASPSTKNNGLGGVNIPIPTQSTDFAEILPKQELSVDDNKVSSTTKNITDLSTKRLALLKIQGKDKRIKIDCWEILRQLVRIPKVEFDLPYYFDDEEFATEEIKVQSKDYVFLGDVGNDRATDNDMKITTSIRDLMKVRQPYVDGTYQPFLYVTGFNTVGTGVYEYKCRVGRVINLPLRPEVTTPLGPNVDAKMPALMQWGGMYQGYRGSVKLRSTIKMKKTNPVVNSISSIRTNDDFIAMMILDEGSIGHPTISTSSVNAIDPYVDGTVDRQPKAIEDIIMCYSNPGISGPYLNYFKSHFPGLMTMQGTLGNNIVFDLEVPVHTFNKYHELGLTPLRRVQELSDASLTVHEAYPYLKIIVFTDFVYISNTLSVTAFDIANDTMVKAAYGGMNISLQTWISIGDELRFGVLDEFPATSTATTDGYATFNYPSVSRSIIPNPDP